MKKLLLSSIVLFLFSASMALFQMSCHKDVIAQTPATTASITQQNKIIYTKNIPLNGANGGYYSDIWVSNYDGSNPHKISITLPAGLFVDYTTFVKLSPDQKTIFFNVGDAKEDNNGTGFYSANIDGTNAKLVVPHDSQGGAIEVAY